MNYYTLRSKVVRVVKKIFNIKNFTVYTRRRKQDIQKLIYRKKYTAEDIINVLRESGVKPGHPILVHSAMGNFYNYQGTAEELIDKLIEFVGPEGTVCMPAYPYDKFNTDVIFDVKTAKSAAGYLTEVFRNYPGVYRSLNQLHSVCAIGKDAEWITRDHQMSNICFDEYSPFYRISELNGYSIALGMPQWYIGTGEHICEALLYNKTAFFTRKFEIEKEYTYRTIDGNLLKHKMKTVSELSYVRKKSTKIIDQNFDNMKYNRSKLSNIWIVSFNMKYLCNKLYELALEGKTIYANPKYFE